jgi:hypothetical protein
MMLLHAGAFGHVHAEHIVFWLCLIAVGGVAIWTQRAR